MLEQVEYFSILFRNAAIFCNLRSLSISRDSGTSSWIFREVKLEIGKDVTYGGVYTESNISQQTVSEVGVDGNKLIFDFEVNGTSFGICRLSDNGNDGFIWW